MTTHYVGVVGIPRANEEICRACNGTGQGIANISRVVFRFGKRMELEEKITAACPACRGRGVTPKRDT